jgi:hypothetical protein
MAVLFIDIVILMFVDTSAQAKPVSVEAGGEAERLQ